VRSFKRAAIVAAAIVLTPAALVLASCSLGLDESLIGQGAEASTDLDVVAIDSGAGDGGDGGPSVLPEAGACTTDNDCKGTAGCFTAKCDVARKRCVFDVCRQTACNSAACTTTASPTTCAPAKPYKYEAAQFPVGAQIGCGGQLGRCFAAAYPFVFVGTTNGVLAFSAMDPQSTAPPSIPITGLGFVPVQMVASGNRVFFIGNPVGIGTSSRLPLAYVDVPSDPFAKKVEAVTVLANYPRPAADPVVLYARGDDTALLVDFNAMTSYASAVVAPPLVEPVTLSSNVISFTAGAAPDAVSGTRLMLGQLNPAGTPLFALASNAGETSTATVPDVAIPSATPASSPSYFAQSPEGAVFWAHVALDGPPAPPAPPPPGIRAAKGYFVIADGSASIDADAGIDLEAFGGAPQGTPTVGPIAMLDAKTVMVTTASPANPTLQTNVSFLTRSPTLAIVKNADATPRRSLIALPVGQLAAAGSHGLGYVLAVDPAAPTAPTVHVFDPACAP
jgi:hypothetical protein